ncbi:MAG: hypothetical protein JOZ93_13580 [Sinobacteraceae bacterium]|nr:hypothetical protein [Nevskiaceae bacterium]MBV9913608.1 hypothetical protein [Nevskiaceae bacterium]
MRHITRSRVLIALALGIGAYVVISGGEDEATPASHPKSAVRQVRQTGEHHSQAAFAVPTLAMLQHRVDAGTAPQALFASHSWYKPPPPPPPAPAASLSPKQPPAPPTAPPLPYAFMGSYAPAGQPPVFFLTKADRVYDVHIGDVIDSTYSIDSFNGRQLFLTYKPLNIQQQLNAEGPQ